MAPGGSSGIQVLIAIAIVGLFGIITFALAAATLGTVNKHNSDLNDKIQALQQKLDVLSNQLPTTTTTTTATTTPTTTPASTSSTAASNTTNIANTASTNEVTTVQNTASTTSG